MYHQPPKKYDTWKTIGDALIYPQHTAFTRNKQHASCEIWSRKGGWIAEEHEKNSWGAWGSQEIWQEEARGGPLISGVGEGNWAASRRGPQPIFDDDIWCVANLVTSFLFLWGLLFRGSLNMVFLEPVWGDMRLRRRFRALPRGSNVAQRTASSTNDMVSTKRCRLYHRHVVWVGFTLHIFMIIYSYLCSFWTKMHGAHKKG